MITHKLLKLSVCGCLSLAGISLPAVAQDKPPASSFEGLRSGVNVRPGETVQIIDEKGTKFNARIAEIRDHAIDITVDGVRRQLPESAVTEIRQRRPDRWWNGMLIGMGVGAAIGTITVASACENDSECAFYTALVALPLATGIGAGVGAAIDFGIKKYDPIYTRPGASIRSGLTVSPILSTDQKGIGVSFGF
jgi:hypothetical protein